MRPDKDTYFFNIAKVVATRSTCLRKNVGAVLVINGQIIATGFNGAPAGEPHCTDVGCSKPIHAVRFEDCKAVHAEVNAIIQAARHGTSIVGATLYCTHSPCVMCQRVLKNAGITDIRFLEHYL